MKPKELKVSYHALDQWRYRAATYGDETEEDVKREFEISTYVKPDEIVPFVRTVNTTYYKHPSGAYFVLVPWKTNPNIQLIITVILPTEEYYGSKVKHYEKRRRLTSEEKTFRGKLREKEIDDHKNKHPKLTSIGKVITPQQKSIKADMEEIDIFAGFTEEQLKEKGKELRKIVFEINEKRLTLIKNSQEWKQAGSGLHEYTNLLGKINKKLGLGKKSRDPAITEFAIKQREKLIEMGLITPAGGTC